MKFDYRLIALNEQMLHMQLSALRKNFTQLGEGAFYKNLLTKVVTGEWAGAHHCPVNVVGHLFEEGAIAVFKSLKRFANTLSCNSHLNLFSLVACSWIAA